MTMKLRLLPLAIGIVFLMLLLQAYEIGRDIKISADGFSVKRSQAQTGDVEPLRLLDDLGGLPPAPDAGQPATGEAMPQTAEGDRRARPAGMGDDPLAGLQQFAQAEPYGVTPAAGDGTGAATPRPGDAAAEPEQVLRSDVLADPSELSQQELTGLLQLQSRRKEIERQERELDHKRRLLQAAELRVDEKIAELNTLKLQIEGLINERDEQQERELASLVKIYETMKPRDAANIFNQLAMPVLLNVADRMNERRLAAILGEMDPARARSITEELLQRRDLPVPRE